MDTKMPDKGAVGANWCSKEEEDEEDSKFAMKVVQERAKADSAEAKQLEEGTNPIAARRAEQLVKNYCLDNEPPTEYPDERPANEIAARRAEQLVKNYCLGNEPPTECPDERPANEMQGQQHAPTPGAVRVTGIGGSSASVEHQSEAGSSVELEISPPIPRTSPSARDLAVARAVVADSTRNLPMGTVDEIDTVEEEAKRLRRKQRTRRYMIAFAVGASLTVTAIVLGVVLGLAKRETNLSVDLNETSTQDTVISIEERYIRSLLSNSTIQRLDDDGSSPQAMALEWLLDHSNITTFPPWRLQQRFALATFQYATGGFPNLDLDVHECNWWFQPSLGGPYYDYTYIQKQLGLETPCNFIPDLQPQEDQGILQNLWLWDSGLMGSLPPEIGMLTALRSINLGSRWNGAGLGGSIPSEIGLCTDLGVLVMTGNNLNGTLPSQIGELSRISFLSLALNQLSGEAIPTEIGVMANLRRLYLGFNQLSGPIPTEIGLLTLKELDLGGNQLSGSIPSEIGLLTELWELDLGGNQLSGPIPSEIGLLAELWELDLGGNQLSGPIPTEIGVMANLWYLHLDATQLSESIPTEIGLL